MMDPDGCATGKVRFNAHGYDLNRYWERVDLRDKQWLSKMPEIWYTKKAILAQQARRPIDLLVNFHNDETNEYMETMVEDGPTLALMQRFFHRVATDTTFDPTRSEVSVSAHPARPTTEVLWPEDHVPVIIMEQGIGPSKKLHHRPTAEDRTNFGAQLIAVMGEVVQ
jgi:hypothetical protein